MACGTDQELSVFIPVRQPDSTKLGDVIFRGNIEVSGKETSFRALRQTCSPIVFVRGCNHIC